MNTESFHPQLLLLAGGVGLVLFFLLVFATMMSRFYRRCGADEALVRTGAGGTEVKIGGGILVMPVLHQLMRVSLRSLRLSVERSGKNALVTHDKIKANVATELYLKVEPVKEDVLAAARSFGERNLDEHAISELIDGKLTDALRSVAANQTFMDLHSKRKEFAEHIHCALAEELKKNGLMLENVSITALAMVPVKDLDHSDVFDAEGLRAITESVQTNLEKTNKIQREKENEIKNQNVLARTRALELDQAQAMAEADQARKVAEYQATQKAETAMVVYRQQQAQELAAYEKQRATETARIEQERAIAIAEAARAGAQREAQIAAEKAQQAAEIAKQREIETAEVEKRQTIETAHIARQIAVTRSEEEAARADAMKLQAEAERKEAEQAIVTVEATARANRERHIAVIKAEEAAQATKIDAQARTAVAEQEALATKLLAEATLRRAEAEAEARRKLVEAENAVGTKLLLRDVMLKALDVMPSVTHELMTPAQAIKDVKVLQLSGMGSQAGADGSSTTSGPFGVASPLLKTLLEAGAVYPLLREMMQFAKVDGDALADKARALFQMVPEELKGALEDDPDITRKLEELAHRASEANGSSGEHHAAHS
ncbi:MAG: hypothetical protein HOW73_24400 [Polyangiaceae bacterium]|nr:hypothetical protein [Polyangiaceae bacterium]